jgi:hypothetical protein
MAAGPDAARVAIVGVLEAGPAARQRFQTAAEPFIPLVDEGRQFSPRGDELPRASPGPWSGGSAP